MRAQDCRAFVKKPYKQFHPGFGLVLLAAVGDSDTRGMIEVAANTVARVLTFDTPAA
jgi:hypothetical protein